MGSEDWQSLVLKLHVDPRSPAFTAVKARESFRKRHFSRRSRLKLTNW